MTKTLSDSISQASGLSAEQTGILSRAVESIINYVGYKNDPLGRRKLSKNIKQIARSTQEDVVKNALSIYVDRATNELTRQNSMEEVFFQTEKYLLNPSFQAFVSNLTDPLEKPKRKKQKKSEYYESRAWWDKFCEYLDNRYEEWRHDLIGRALYQEQEYQGSVSYTTLWTIAHLPPHSWDDLTQFKAISGELWVNGQYFYNFLPGTYSVLSAIDYPIMDDRRLVSDLIESLDEDNLQKDTGVIVLREEDENIFKLDDKEYLIEKTESYEDPMFDSVENTPLDGKIRVFGTKLTYIGEEILDLAVGISSNIEIEKVFELGLRTLTEDGVRFTRR